MGNYIQWITLYLFACYKRSANLTHGTAQYLEPKNVNHVIILVGTSAIQKCLVAVQVFQLAFDKFGSVFLFFYEK